RRGPQDAGLEHAAPLERRAPAALRARGAPAATPGVPAIIAADPVRPLGSLDDLRRARAPGRGDPLLPEILRQPLEVDVIVGGDDPVVHRGLPSAAQSRAGVSGMSRCVTPRGASASTAAFTTAGGMAMHPASPTPTSRSMTSTPDSRSILTAETTAPKLHTSPSGWKYVLDSSPGVSPAGNAWPPAKAAPATSFHVTRRSR